MFSHGPEITFRKLRDFAQSHVFNIEIHFTGFDFGKIQNIVDQFHQILARSLYRFGVLNLFRAQRILRIVREHLRQNQQAVQRRAQLMRHIREKL